MADPTRTHEPVRLTKRTVDAAEARDREYILWDSDIRGFGLRVIPPKKDGDKPRKVYLLKYRTKAGKPRKPNIGVHGDITADQARQIAENWKADIAKGGADNLRLRQHGSDELAHYAKDCYDVEYRFPMGWSELEGIAHRGDYDLKAHTAASGRKLDYFDDKTRQRYVPYVIEPAAGADRATLAFLTDAYREEEVRGRQRTVLRLHPALAPIKVAILPLLRNRADVVETARKLYADLRRHFPADYNDTGAIGKLYARQDEVGTPFCITIDVQTLEDHQVTIRDRDTTEQERLGLDQVRTYIEDKLTVD